MMEQNFEMIPKENDTYKLLNENHVYHPANLVERRCDILEKEHDHYSTLIKKEMSHKIPCWEMREHSKGEAFRSEKGKKLDEVIHKKKPIRKSLDGTIDEEEDNAYGVDDIQTKKDPEIEPCVSMQHSCQHCMKTE